MPSGKELPRIEDVVRVEDALYLLHQVDRGSIQFLADEGYEEPVLIISGFDRRVLESAYRLGEALGLQMIGPLEKPARLEELEAILNQVRSTLVP